MQVGGRPTTQANRDFRLPASQKCFHRYSFTFWPFSSRARSSCPKALPTNGACAPWELEAVLFLIPSPLTWPQNSFQASLEVISSWPSKMPPHLHGRLWRWQPGPSSQQHKAWAESKCWEEPTLIIWSLGSSRIPHPASPPPNTHFFILEAESNLWSKRHFLNGDSAHFLSRIINFQLA